MFVHCHRLSPNVHCRIGSLEKNANVRKMLQVVHCRIGSLEKSRRIGRPHITVHCRIGSLEKQGYVHIQRV